MAVMWSWIFFLSFSGTPHFLYGFGASLIRCPVNSGRGAAASFLRKNHYECHPLLDIESRMDEYSPTQLF